MLGAICSGMQEKVNNARNAKTILFGKEKDGL
jgi:hypothetical protein